MAPQIPQRQLVVFTLAGEPYALPIRQIQEIIRYRPPRSVVSGEPWIRGVLSLRGRIIPVYELAARLGLTSQITDRTEIVIVDTGADIVGVIVDGVDEVLMVDEAVINPAPGADLTLIEAVVEVGDRLVVLLDLAGIVVGMQPAGV